MDLQDAIERFDLFEFLDEERIDYSMEGDNIGEGWIGVETCLNCDDSDYHLGINIESKTTHCWKCGWNTNLIGFIAKAKEISTKKAIEFIKEETELDEDSMDVLQKISSILNEKPETRKEEKPLETFLLNSKNWTNISSRMLKTNEAIKEFFKDRKLERKHVAEYELRIGTLGQYRGKLIFPIIHEKTVVAYQTRSLFDSRYKITGPAHSYLYKYDEIPNGGRIIVVEGILDRIRLDDFVCKFYKNKYYTTTGFSKLLTDDQIKLLNNKKPKMVIYMLDRDAWFDYKNSDSKLNCPSTFIILPQNKDPGSMNEKEYLKLFRENDL